VACSGGSGAPAFEGCGSDADCKGDRICVDRQCVDPGAGGTGVAAAGVPGGGGGGLGGGSGASAAGESDAGDAGLDAGGGVPGQVVDDPLLEAACIGDCEAKHEAGCEMPIGSLDQCMGQCLVIDEYGHGYCAVEQRAHYACLAAGGYTCAAGYPQPKATCIAEATALSLCNQEVPCRRFCDVAKGRCAPGGSMCFETCSAEKTGFDDLICSFDYDRLLTCWSNDLVCNGSRPAVTGCEEAVAEIADCIGRRQTYCDGYCWALNILGCGTSDCAASCTEKSEHPSCGYRYEGLLRCAYQSSLNVTCESGDPVFGVECDSNVQDYDTCIQNL
jgi:hypothetical protein